MRKNTIKYICKSCGYESLKWAGKCLGCGEWGTMEELELPDTKTTRKIPKVKKLTEAGEEFRIKTDIPEFDRVLGDGAVKGEVVLLGGNPGIGKSTLLLYVCEKMLIQKKKVLYFSAEESIGQISQRSRRILENNEIVRANLDIVNSLDADEAVSAVLKGKYDFAVIDSIQTICTQDMQSQPGSISQVRECASRLSNAAKKTDTILTLVGHVNKDGDIAGPMSLAHIVDAVFLFEGSRFDEIRILRSVKNRFGNTNEIGVFEMTDRGVRCMNNISKIFSSLNTSIAPGSAKGIILEGARPMMVDVQSLVAKTSYPIPKRVSNGIGLTRMQMLIAVLTKYAKINLFEYDIYVNIAGGFNVKDPSLDLAVCAAVLSSYLEKSISSTKIFIGEVGLSGEIRDVYKLKIRVDEAHRMAVSDVYTSKKLDNIKSLYNILKYHGA